MAKSLDLDKTALENGKQFRPWSDSREWQKAVDPDQTVPENDSVELDLDQTAENGK